MKKQPIKTNFVLPQDETKSLNENYYVVKHNDMIRKVNYNRVKTSNPSLTLLEQKMLLLIISKIKPNDKDFKDCEFNIKEVAELFGINTTNNNSYYGDIKDVITGLLSKVVWIDKGDVETTAHLIYKATIEKGNGNVSIKLDVDLKQFLLNLYSQYTRYPLKNVIKMRSKYGIMLYELLKSYEYECKYIEFDIDDLKEHLDCKSYDNFTNFKKRVIDAAVKEINEKTDLQVSVAFVKVGRVFQKVVFKFWGDNET